MLMNITKGFSNFARRIAHLAGQPIAFVLTCAFVVIWSLTGPIFDFSNTWQLVVNTGSSIVTFLMVFVTPLWPF